jgi:hypothetical protein
VDLSNVCAEAVDDLRSRLQGEDDVGIESGGIENATRRS